MTPPNRPADGALFDFSERVKLRVSGSDRIRFLNGQLTNDARKASESEALEACVLNPKGKMDAHMFLIAEADSFLIDADAELRESLQPRLERYIIADDVQVEDVSEKLSILHLLIAERPSLGSECNSASAHRFAARGWDIWVPREQRGQLAAQLSQQFGFCDSECAEIFRIEQGMPRWGRELTPEIIPVEANLEERCVDYEKGCYIGQETISRMKMSGQQNKKLCGLMSPSDSLLSTGARLYGQGEGGRDVGWITSAAHSSRLGKNIALGYVKRGFNATGTKLAAGPVEDAARGVQVEIVDLPFS
jgi:tRNA-modifying protein YgfZ